MAEKLNITSFDDLLSELNKQKNKREEETILNVIPDSENENQFFNERRISLKNLSNININFNKLNIRGLDFSGSENITISNSTINAPSEGSEEILKLTNSRRILIQFNNFIGNNSGSGLAISHENIDGITIDKCTFYGFRDAISIRNGSSDIVISNNQFSNIGRDAIGIHDCSNVKIMNNEIYDFHPNYEGFEAIELAKKGIVAYLPDRYPVDCTDYKNLKASNVPADHADCIQLTNSNYVTIIGNEMGSRDGEDETNSTWTQSIFIQHSMNNYPADNYLNITSNIIRNRHLHGISIEGYKEDDVTLSDNDLIYAASENYCYLGNEISVPIITEKYS